MLDYDYLVVGAGLTGAICAERLAAKKNKKVLVIDKRNHIAGNCYDYYDKTGILVHKYGPHIFHTNSLKVWAYLSQFTSWNNFRLKAVSKIKNQYYQFPININTINKLFDLSLNRQTIRNYYQKNRIRISKIGNAEDYILSLFGREIYEKFYKFYTKKHWGLWPAEISAEILKRIPVRYDYCDEYFDDRYQGLPKQGYTQLITNILAHKNIELMLDTDYFKIKNKFRVKKIIFTGSIDKYFDFKFGSLLYRSLKMKYESYSGIYQKYAMVHYPSFPLPRYTRIIEFKHMTKQKSKHTTIAKVYASSWGEPMYPILNSINLSKYNKYYSLAKKIKDTYFIGRLAEYKYYDMDDVCLNALQLAENIN